ncbi:MAG TPA: hypothetical protein PKL71_02495, partial [Marmoricola sp.]|nr:hypothetical protein [Marmoricola sp.]
EVVSHWVETRPWWLGSGSGQTSEAAAADPDLLDEHEVWRVTAIDPGRGVGAAGPTVPIGARGGFGVFDLALNITEGNWKLSRALD